MGFSLSSVRDWFNAEPAKEAALPRSIDTKVADLYPAASEISGGVRDDIFTLEMPDLPDANPFAKFDTGGKRYGFGIQLNAVDPLAPFKDFGKVRDETPMTSMFNYEISTNNFDVDSWFEDLSPKKVSADTNSSFEKVWAEQGATPVVEKKSLWGSIKGISSKIGKKVNEVFDGWIDADAVIA